MLVPEGYTYDEVVEIIQRVVATLARKFTFDIYDVEDIKQEAFILAVDSLPKYNGSVPLGNYIRIHLTNKLKDFKRDNSYRINIKCNNCESFNAKCESCCKRQQTQDMKKNLLNPIDIYVAHDDKNIYYDGSLIDTLEMVEIVDRINKKLPVEYRQDYLKIKEGVHVPKARKDEIEAIIIKIVEDEDDE